MSNSGPGYRSWPEHKITVEPFHHLVLVRHGGMVIARSNRALELREAQYPPVIYVPREDVLMDRLVPTDHSTYCPFKGRARYWSLRAADSQVLENVAWSYETPYDEVTMIKEHVAFYPDKVEISQEAGAQD